jgi:cation diffusion facilitator CzcD-associated flavoprotein CzcO
MTPMHEVDLIRQEKLRRRVTETVTDPATARDLQPWYPGWCKRPCFSDEFLAAFNRPNVVLVDTNGKGINTVTDKGILFEGTEFDLDAIILGTGYAPTGSAAHSGIPITGRDGRTLEQKWLSSMASFHGICTNGFPNLFFPGPSQAGASVNQVYVLDQLARHVVYIILEAEKLNAGSHDDIGRLTIEPSTEAEEEWTSKILSRAGAFGGLLACTPSYFNREGLRLSEDQSFLAARFSIWGEGIRSFVEEIEGWRNKGQLVGMEISSR